MTIDFGTVEGYDAGVLLHRLALYCQHDTALVTPTGSFRWCDLRIIRSRMFTRCA